MLYASRNTPVMTHIMRNTAKKDFYSYIRHTWRNEYAYMAPCMTETNKTERMQKLMENKQRAVEREVKELIQKYNALYKDQVYEYFAKDGREQFVGRALKILEKERDIYINQERKLIAVNEEAYGAREYGTLQCVWALLGIMDQKKVEEHFLASREEYPVRIVFVGDGEIYDILYVSEAEVSVTNNLFARKRIDGCGHIVVVENPEDIPEIQIPDVIGFCTVKEDGKVEYYRKDE